MTRTYCDACEVELAGEWYNFSRKGVRERVTVQGSTVSVMLELTVCSVDSGGDLCSGCALRAAEKAIAQRAGRPEVEAAEPPGEAAGE